MKMNKLLVLTGTAPFKFGILKFINKAKVIVFLKAIVLAGCGTGLLFVTINSYADPNLQATPKTTAQTMTQKTGQYFDAIKNNPTKLTQFLQKMPLGGDIHNHIDGAVYAENLIKYGANEEFCINPKTMAVYKNSSCANKYQLKNIPLEPVLYAHLIDTWSMRNFPINRESGEAHFFNAFLLFEPLVIANPAQVIAGIAQRAQRENEIYLELMIGELELQVTDSENKNSAQIGKQIGLQKNLSLWREQLLRAGVAQMVTRSNLKIDQLNQKIKKILKCDTDKADPACHLTIRYQYFALRDLPLPQFYAQLVTAFAVANSNPTVVGINIVMPENWHIALNDYTKQMEMIGYLHTVYPKVNIILHAGELAFGLLPPKYLSHHIRQAINVAHAQRIGHGVDIIYEKNSQQLLNEMRKKHILVETNLTSNADVLGLTGKKHPLPLYLKAGVPVTLSTDDEGIERTDLENEYKRAVLSYGYSYDTLKRFARNSISYSFLPGKNLWQNRNKFIVVNACKNTLLGSSSDKTSKNCAVFLKTSEKAGMQWKLENKFNEFEKHDVHNTN